MDDHNQPNHHVFWLDLLLPCFLVAIVALLAWIAVWLFGHTYTPPECCAHGHPKVAAAARHQHDVASPGALTPRVLKPTDSNSTNCPAGANCGIVLCK